MEFNLRMSTLFFNDVCEEYKTQTPNMFSMNFMDFNQGIKYLSFNIKQGYKYEDHIWLYNKIEAKTSLCNLWLSRGWVD